MLLVPTLLISACTVKYDANETTNATLVHIEVDEGPVENGKRLKMTFTEVERVGAVSRVAVKFTSGGSVSSSLFQVRGNCMIAQKRGAKYFWSLGNDRHVGDLSLSETQFANGRGVSLTAFSIEDCKRLGLIH